MNTLLTSSPLSRRQLHTCLAAAMLLALLPVAPISAATSPLGFTLGKTTLDEVERSLPRDKIKKIGLSSVTEGPVLEIDPAAFEFDGLEKVLLVFETNQRLAIVILTIAKQRFRDVLTDLRSKYIVENQNIDNFMKNGKAKFRSDNDVVLFNAPHLSFSLDLSYITDKLWRETLRRTEEEVIQKRQQERGKL